MCLLFQAPRRRSSRPKGWFRRVTAALGPGVITGAADDDPSGMATYSIVGSAVRDRAAPRTALPDLAQPLMAAVQMMCARIGMVTGEGLAAALRKEDPEVGARWSAASALLAANTINIGAVLAGMADAAAMVSRLQLAPSSGILFGLGITVARPVRLRHTQLAGGLKWLALVLFSLRGPVRSTSGPTGASGRPR